MRVTLSLSTQRAWRIFKKVPSRAFEDWYGVIGNRSELFSLALAILTSWIGLQTASIPQMVEEAAAWTNAVQAFIYVALGWAVICLFRAPFVIRHEEALKGNWYEGRFVYNEPVLVDSAYLGQSEKIVKKMQFLDAEPRSSVKCILKSDRGLITLSLTDTSSETPASCLAGPKLVITVILDRRRSKWFHLSGNSKFPQVIKIYMLEFTLAS